MLLKQIDRMIVREGGRYLASFILLLPKVNYLSYWYPTKIMVKM